MPAATLPERQTLSVEEAATLLGIGRTTAYAAVRSGTIPSVRIHRRVVVPRAAIERLLIGDTSQVVAPATRDEVRS